MKTSTRLSAWAAILLAGFSVYAQTFSSTEQSAARPNAQYTAQGTHVGTQPESARTLGNQTASTQSDSVQTPVVVPTCSNGGTDYPTCTPPSCANGGTNYPTCTPPTCANGATNYPTCSLSMPVCSNGATNYPACTLTTSGTETQTIACPSPQTGSISQVRTVTYTNGTPTAYGTWTTTSSSCTGGGGPTVNTYNENQTIACTAPQTGTITQTRSVTVYSNGAPTAYGPWATTGSNCVSPPVCTSSPGCEGVNLVTRDSCTNAIQSVTWNSPSCGFCAATYPAACEGTSYVTRDSCTGVVQSSVANSPICGGVLPSCSNGASDYPTCTPPDPFVTIYVPGYCSPGCQPSQVRQSQLSSMPAGGISGYHLSPEACAAFDQWGACGM